MTLSLFVIAQAFFLCSAVSLDGVKNFRSVGGCSGVFRSAGLEDVSLSSAKHLVDPINPLLGEPLGSIIDLRNQDERTKRSQGEGASHLYSNLVDYGMVTEAFSRREKRDNNLPKLYHVPLLGDVDAFWDEVIARMPAGDRVAATLQTIFISGALDRAACRFLEAEGLPLMYTAMLATSGPKFAALLNVIAQDRAEGRAVLFHCQKGKDRTGLVAMLLQSCAGIPDGYIVDDYALSGGLLGGDDALDQAARGAAVPANMEEGRQDSNGLDWSRFRGSPESAMVATLAWLRTNHGSIHEYLKGNGFDKSAQLSLKSTVADGLVP